MKICVVTIYNGSNYGARLQSLALKHVLQSKGHEVVHLETGARNPRHRAIKKIIKRLLTLDWRKESLKFQWDTGSLFVKEAKEFEVCNKQEASKADVVIFGSDEIWNIKRKMIYRYPVLFGTGIENDNKVAYAVSINDATETDFNKKPFSLREMNKFKSIMVRDVYSQQVLSSLMPDKTITTVLDPTFLPEKSFYEDILEITDKKNYILLYSYGNHLTDNAIEQIKQFAKKKNLQLVSVLGYFDWCDCNYPYTTNQVLGLFRDAEYVFTDTFHGSIFSILFEKQFVVISKGTKKLDLLLDTFALQTRKIEGNTMTLEEIAEKTIDYGSVNQKRNELRCQSLKEIEHRILC